MKKLFLILLVVLFAVPAFAQENEIHISNHLPIVCGDGTVRFSGKAFTRDDYDQLIVVVGDNGSWTTKVNVTLTRNEWYYFNFDVSVVEDNSYDVSAYLRDSFSNWGELKEHSITVGACNETDLLELKDIVQDRLDTLP